MSIDLEVDPTAAKLFAFAAVRGVDGATLSIRRGPKPSPFFPELQNGDFSAYGTSARRTLKASEARVLGR